LQKKSRLRTASILNFAVSDGKTTLVSRVFVSTQKDDKRKPATLYFSIGSRFAQCTDGVYRMRQTNMDENVVIVSSERLTPVTEDWVSVPENHILLISHKSNILLFAVDVHGELKKAKLEMQNEKKKSQSQSSDHVSNVSIASLSSQKTQNEGQTNESFSSLLSSHDSPILQTKQPTPEQVNK